MKKKKNQNPKTRTLGVLYTNIWTILTGDSSLDPLSFFVHLFFRSLVLLFFFLFCIVIFVNFSPDRCSWRGREEGGSRDRPVEFRVSSFLISSLVDYPASLCLVGVPY